MQFKIITLLSFCLFIGACAIIKPNNQLDQASKIQEKPEWATVNYGYKPTKEILSDLLHTKLEVSFDWKKKQMAGKAYLTFKPYFYAQDTLVLDARGFDIKGINKFDKTGKGKELKFSYVESKLTIKLDKQYLPSDTFTLFIDYVAKPEELKVGGGEAINSDKGLFFITPDSANPNKPYQIWTQGETESSSCWFPTVESPSEKCTQEIFITVDNKFKTLSNGEFMYSHSNANGTRTDYWKQSLPHSVYLVMLAVGEFSVVTDKWDKIPVSYYVEPAYEKYARTIFGLTPEMMTFFSQKLKYKFPWAKYSSVVVREYVSGAMENTSATVFMDALQKTDRELLDENYENIIAHELFHHWFGDLVTAESWAHLPLNESFATYAETMWEEHKRGKMAADYARTNDLENYMREAEVKREPLIRYGYKNPDDMFDSHSYAKGGCILHMLKELVGDSAFYRSLNVYLTNNAFKSTEIHHLRHAFEEVTGQDLNWFFNQWFLKAGHPELEVMDSYNNGKLKVKIWQTQDTLYAPIYQLPIKLEIYVGDNKVTKEIWLNKRVQLFEFELETKPNLVLIDPSKTLVATLKHSKSKEEYITQYLKSDTYFSKYQALDELGKYKDSARVKALYVQALDEPFWKLREIAVENLEEYRGEDSTKVLLKLSQLAQNDKNTSVRASAISAISRKARPRFESIYKSGLSDSSFAVVGASLYAYLKLKPSDIDQTLLSFEGEINYEIIQALSGYYSLNFDSTKYQWFEKKIKEIKPESLFFLLQDFGNFLIKSSPKMQEMGSNILIPIAEKSQFEWVRYSAYKSLISVGLKSKETDLKRIKSGEKSERLKRMYKNI